MPGLNISTKNFGKVNFEFTPDQTPSNPVIIKGIARHPLIGFILKWFGKASEIKYTDKDNKDKTHTIYVDTKSLFNQILLTTDEIADHAARKNPPHPNMHALDFKKMNGVDDDEIPMFKKRLKEANIKIGSIDNQKFDQIFNFATTFHEKRRIAKLEGVI